MVSLSQFQRILFVLVIVGAVATGQRTQSQQQQQQQQQQQEQHQPRDHYDFSSAHLPIQFQDYAAFLLFNPFGHYTTSGKQYAFKKPIHQFQNFNFPKGNGNSLATADIGMEILSDSLPPNMENPIGNDDINADDYPEYSFAQRDWLNFLKKEDNFRRSKTPLKIYAQETQDVSDNPNWHKYTLNYDIGDTTPLDIDEKTNNGAIVPHATNETTSTTDEYEPNVKIIKTLTDTLDSPMIEHSGNELESNSEHLWQKFFTKRNPLSLDHYRNTFTQPRYPVAFLTRADGGGGKRNDAYLAKMRSSKRERIRPQRTSFIPSVSTGAMTHLGNFFNDLSKNVHFNERNEFGEAETKLLQGDHPLQMLQSDVADESNEQAKIEKTAKFLQAIRSYRPSQKIRSLVSMNPQGYHGSNFLDPNYMWVGLG